tara:strand:+ start:1155 stop:1361 length:207 start_codon:yes stop_codon:yes gene_type:complete
MADTLGGMPMPEHPDEIAEQHKADAYDEAVRQMFSALRRMVEGPHNSTSIHRAEKALAAAKAVGIGGE